MKVSDYYHVVFKDVPGEPLSDTEEITTDDGDKKNLPWPEWLPKGTVKIWSNEYGSLLRSPDNIYYYADTDYAPGYDEDSTELSVQEMSTKEDLEGLKSWIDDSGLWAHGNCIDPVRDASKETLDHFYHYNRITGGQFDYLLDEISKIEL